MRCVAEFAREQAATFGSRPQDVRLKRVLELQDATHAAIARKRLPVPLILQEALVRDTSRVDIGQVMISGVLFSRFMPFGTPKVCKDFCQSYSNFTPLERLQSSVV